MTGSIIPSRIITKVLPLMLNCRAIPQSFSIAWKQKMYKEFAPIQEKPFIKKETLDISLESEYTNKDAVVAPMISTKYKSSWGVTR